MKRILLLGFLISGLGSLKVNAQNYRWVTGGNSNTTSMVPKRSAMDVAGNTVVTGTYLSDIDMNFSSAAADTAILHAEPSGSAGENVFFAKYDENGHFKWAKHLYNREAASSMAVTDITTDQAGNIYIAGNYAGSCDFNPSPAPADTTIKYSTFGFGTYFSSMYVAKYDTAGNFVWVMNFSGSLPTLNDISIKGNRLYITGAVTSVPDLDPPYREVDFNPSELAGDTLFLNGAGYIENPFLASYDLNGNFKMAKRIYDDFTSFKGNAIEADQAGNVYLAGNLMSTHDLDPSTVIADTAYLSGVDGAFLAKYDSIGSYIWAEQIAQTTNYSFSDNRQLLKVLPNDIYVSGFYKLNPDFDPGSGPGDTLFFDTQNAVSSYLSRFSATGSFQNAYGLGNPTNMNTTQITALEADDSSNLYVAGVFTDKVDFDLQRGTADTLFSQSAGTMGNPDIFFAQYNNDTLNWFRKIGNSDVQNLNGMGVKNKCLTIFGTYTGNVIFDPMPPANLASQLPADGVYLASYRTSPPDTGKQLLTYSFTSPATTGTIMPTDTVLITVPFGTNITNLVANFTVSPEAIAMIGTILQTTGVTPNDFTNIVTYTIMAEDSSTRDYYVKLTVSPSTGITEISGSDYFKLWPNPASDKVQFDRPLDVTICDMNGKILLSVSGAKEIYVGNLTPGIYIIKDKQGHQQKLSIR